MAEKPTTHSLEPYIAKFQVTNLIKYTNPSKSPCIAYHRHVFFDSCTLLYDWIT